MISWTALNSVDQLDRIDSDSASGPVVLFKHSTRCFTSSSVLQQLEARTEQGSVPFYFLDLIAHRAVSNEIERRYGVLHESPQLLVIRNGKADYHASHGEIVFRDLPL